MGRWIITVLFLGLSAFLTRMIPFSSFFRNLNTMLHEFGHALITLILSGRVTRIELNPDHSGVTYSLLQNSWSIVPIALAGYVLASLFALLFFYLYSMGKERLGIIAATLIAAVMLLFFVHQGFGLWWLIGFIVLNMIVLFFGGVVQHFYYILLSFLALEESVMSTITVIVYAVTDPKSGSDAAALQAAIGVPAVIWAILFILVAFWCAQVSLRLLFTRWKQEYRSKRNANPLDS